jgi:hypothetical protein
MYIIFLVLWNVSRRPKNSLSPFSSRLPPPPHTEVLKLRLSRPSNGLTCVPSVPVRYRLRGRQGLYVSILQHRLRRSPLSEVPAVPYTP